MDAIRQIALLKRDHGAAYEIADHCYWDRRPIVDSHSHRPTSDVRSRRQARIVLTIHELLAEIYGEKRPLNRDEIKCLRGNILPKQFLFRTLEDLDDGSEARVKQKESPKKTGGKQAGKLRIRGGLNSQKVRKIQTEPE